MAVRRVTIGEAEQRRPPLDGAPTVEAVLGAGGDWPVGILHVTVPPGGGMPEHDHGDSATVVMPLSGAVRIVEAGADPVEVAPGALAAIPVGDRVRLDNAGDREARLLVILAPADFIEHVTRWPAADAAQATTV